MGWLIAQRPSEISLRIVEEQAAVTQRVERENNGSRVGVKIHWLALKWRNYIFFSMTTGENKQYWPQSISEILNSVKAFQMKGSDYPLTGSRVWLLLISRLNRRYRNVSNSGVLIIRLACPLTAWCLLWLITQCSIWAKSRSRWNLEHRNKCFQRFDVVCKEVFVWFIVRYWITLHQSFSI